MGLGGISIEGLVVWAIVGAAVLGWMARNRGLSTVGWAVFGAIPMLSLLGFMLLLFVRPKTTTTESKLLNQ